MQHTQFKTLRNGQENTYPHLLICNLFHYRSGHDLICTFSEIHDHVHFWNFRYSNISHVLRPLVVTEKKLIADYKTVAL